MKKNLEKKLHWGYLLHLGYNMWSDRGPDNALPEGVKSKYPPRSYLRCDKKLWDEILVRFAKAGGNMVVIDLGEGVKYESHPELAVRGSWSPSFLKKELAKIRKIGLEPIPKLNFSTTHDFWLGKYSRMVSTDIYYGVCRDLIEEVINIFDKPRYFHLGMDEETAGHQWKFLFACMRQHELWWHDLYFFVNQVEKRNVRAWIWSDYIWHHPEEYHKMPKSVVQSNWYYGKVFNKKLVYVRAYHELEKMGYDQIPTGSTWESLENFTMTVKYCKKHISPERLLGFLQTPWRATLKYWRKTHIAAIEEVKKGIKIFEKGE
ncbi:MAG: Tat pathway signal protein [Candidatus Omnitrophica bacterium]|nr:Tat pathway signal protein [Candidatus Omnitrophota bacterium]MCM8816436.1 Tat pathway signal protein [Candidatus Omnitrophota bacterium]